MQGQWTLTALQDVSWERMLTIRRRTGRVQLVVRHFPVDKRAEIECTDIDNADTPTTDQWVPGERGGGSGRWARGLSLANHDRR